MATFTLHTQRWCTTPCAWFQNCQILDYELSCCYLFFFKSIIFCSELVFTHRLLVSVSESGKSSVPSSKSVGKNTKSHTLRQGRHPSGLCSVFLGGKYKIKTLDVHKHYIYTGGSNASESLLIYCFITWTGVGRDETICSSRRTERLFVFFQCDDAVFFFYRFSRDLFSSCGLAALAPTPSCHHFLWHSQLCGQEHTLPLIREYYLRGQHSSASLSFCQWCISFCGCPESVSVVRAPQGALCDPVSSTWNISLSRFFSL